MSAARTVESLQGSTTPAATATWPHFDDEMVEAVARVLRSGKVNYWTGNEGRLFEEEFARAIGCRHAIALANGTVALELALHALDIGPGDEVIVPSRTFIATASCVVTRGARPVCVDVDRDSQTITADTIRPHLTARTKVIIPVHLAGWPCDMDPILALARERNLAVIEDCAQAHGATYKGRVVGSIGDMAAFSFCQDKIITTAGEGGMLVTNRTELWDRAWRYKDHGKQPAAFYNSAPASAQFRWLHDSFGSNYRMSEVQAAVGRIALRRLPQWLAARAQNAGYLANSLRDYPALRTPQPPAHIRHAYYKFYTFVRPDRLADGWNRDRVCEALRGRGVGCSSGSCSEIYLEQAFPPAWRPDARLPAAQELGSTSLMFVVHPTLRSEHLQSVCDAVRAVMDAASKTSTRKRRPAAA